MAGLFDSAIQVAKRGFHSLVGNDNEVKNGSHPDNTVKSSKRAPSPPDPQHQPRRKRVRSQISSEEQRLLLPHSVVSTPGSVEIAVPANDWTTSSMTGKRKVGGGIVIPRNTLQQSSASVRPKQLSTTISSGYNVPLSTPNKRRRIDGKDAAQDDGNLEPDDWFDREQQESSPRPRKPSRQESIVSVHSQDKDNSSQDRRFSQNEYKNLDKLIGPQKQRKRKPKSSSAANSQMDIQELRSPTGTSSAPFAVEDDDDDMPQITGVMQSVRRPPTQKTPRAIQSSPIRASPGQPVIEVKGAFSAQLEEQRARERKKAAVPGMPIRTLSPPIRGRFTRTNDPPPLKARDRMQAISVSKPTTKTESSDDELASSNNAVSSSTKKNAPGKSQPSLPPSDIKSSRFFNASSKKSPGKSNAYVHAIKDDAPEPSVIPLKSIYTQSAQLEGDTLMLMFAPQAGLFAIHNNGKTVSIDGTEIRITAKHIQRVRKSSQVSNAMYITGVLDAITGSKIWLDFRTREDRDNCIAAILSITHDAVKITNVEDVQLNAFHETIGKFFSARKTMVADPEIQAMQNRQISTTSKALTSRDRAKVSQQGFSAPEPEIQMTPSRLTRKAAMKSDFANLSSSATIKGSSPQPEAHTEPSASTRTSRRISKKDVEQVALPEPEFEQWTKEHGVPHWESPLVYPANGAKRTTVDAIDIERLDDGEFLNDNIISFYLRYLEENNPDLKDQVYIFNTFFYSALSTNKQGKRTLNYDAVKRWTKNIDLFKYPIVVVPVNANYHWFLIIICNLDKLEQTLTSEDEEPEEEKELTPPLLLKEEIPESPQDPKDEVLSQRVGRLSLDHTGATEQKPNQRHTGKLPSASRKGEKKPSKVDLNAPSIITLDSLGSSHTAEVRHLKEYVALEGKDKRGLDFEYSLLRGVVAKGIPHQTNFYDCGVYLVGYMVELLKDPSEFVRKVLSRELDRNNDFAGFDPTEKRVEIRDLLLKLADEQKEAKKARKREAHLAKRAAQQANSSEEPKSRGATPAARSSPIKSPSRFTNHAPGDEQDEMLMVNGTRVASPGCDASAKPAFAISSSFSNFANELHYFATPRRD